MTNARVCLVEFDLDAGTVWVGRGDTAWTDYENVTPASFRRLLRAIEHAPVTVAAVLGPVEPESNEEDRQAELWSAADILEPEG